MYQLMDQPPPENPLLPLGLAPDPEPSGRAIARRVTSEKYAHPIAFYCAAFNPAGRPLDRKTVERWIGRGRRAEGGMDLPPLDDPPRMAEWWRRTMRRKVPEVFEFLEMKAQGGAGSEGGEVLPGGGRVVPGESDSPAAVRESLRNAMVAADAGSLGFQAALDRARLAERLAWFQWQAVLMEPEKFSVGNAERRKKSWEQASVVLMRAEERAEKILGQSDEWAKWAEVERKVGPILSAVASGVRTLFVRLANKFPPPPGEFEPMNRAFQVEVDALFANLGEGDFRPVLSLES